MNKLSSYIIEKLKINKNSKINKSNNLIEKITRISDESILNIIYSYLEDNNDNLDLDKVHAYYSARHFPEYILNDLNENELKHVHKLNALDFHKAENNYFSLEDKYMDDYFVYGNNIFEIFADDYNIVYVKYLDKSLKVFFINY